MRIPLEWTRLEFVDDVRREHGVAWAVGGAVRDLALGRPPKDLDVVVCGIPARRLEEVLSRTGKVSFVGKSFGVFKWTPPSGETVDVGMPREERSTGPGHRDFDVVCSEDLPIEEDLARRDFTFNAVAIRLPDGRVIDPFGGLADLDESVLRAVGRPEHRFEEDPLRILRGAGFVARFGLIVDAATRDAMRSLSGLLESVSEERIATELVKLLALGPRPSDGLRLLVQTGGMRYVIPEFLESVGFDQQHPQHHLPLDEHVYAVVDEAARRRSGVVVRTAALLHDIAKPRTFTLEKTERGEVVGRTMGHDASGAEMARTILDRLRFSAAEGFPAGGDDDVVALVRYHLVDVTPTSTDRAWRRWIHRVGGRRRIRLLLELWAADRAGHREGLDETRLEAMYARLDRVTDPPADQHSLALDGDTIARETGLTGRAIGRMKEQLLAKVIDGVLPNRREDLLAEVRRSAGRDR